MSINIKNLKNKDKCIKNEISTISENKGILLGLLYFILKNYNNLINNKININLTKFKKILKILFPDLNFLDKFTETNNSFNININTKEIVDLNITYINFLEEIKANKVYIVPWFDGDNPLIMFEKSNKEQNIDKIKNKISDWDNCSRTQQYNKFNNYDEFIENNILNKYIEFNNKWSYDDLTKFINTSLSNQIIINKIIEKKKNIPIPYFVPIPVNNYSTQNNNLQKVNQENKSIPVQNQENKSSKSFIPIPIPIRNKQNIVPVPNQENISKKTIIPVPILIRNKQNTVTVPNQEIISDINNKIVNINKINLNSFNDLNEMERMVSYLEQNNNSIKNTIKEHN